MTLKTKFPTFSVLLLLLFLSASINNLTAQSVPRQAIVEHLQIAGVAFVQAKTLAFIQTSATSLNTSTSPISPVPPIEAAKST